MSDKTHKRPASDLPERVPDTPENVAKALFGKPPKKQWRYVERHKSR